MKIIPLTIILLLNLTNVFGQYDFLFTKKTLQEVRNYEDSLKSKKLGFVKTNVAKDYFPTAMDKYDYYPLNYIRTNDNFYPELHIAYYYNENDSSLLATSYDWNIMDYIANIKTDGDKFETEKKRKKEYLEKYNSVKTYLTSKLGKPTSISEEKSATGYFYKLIWEQDKIEVLVLFKFSTQLTYLPGNMIVGSYNIRVKVDYTK